MRRRKMYDMRRSHEVEAIGDRRFADFVFCPTMDGIMERSQLGTFASVDEARQAWGFLRDEMMACFPLTEGPLYGPSGWWLFDTSNGPLEFVGEDASEKRRQYLEAKGHLTGAR